MPTYSLYPNTANAGTSRPLHPQQAMNGTLRTTAHTRGQITHQGARPMSMAVQFGHVEDEDPIRVGKSEKEENTGCGCIMM